jgi:uncharacterized membrane protein YiaA
MFPFHFLKDQKEKKKETKTITAAFSPFWGLLVDFIGLWNKGCVQQQVLDRFFISLIIYKITQT